MEPTWRYLDKQPGPQLWISVLVARRTPNGGQVGEGYLTERGWYLLDADLPLEKGDVYAWAPMPRVPTDVREE